MIAQHHRKPSPMPKIPKTPFRRWLWIYVNSGFVGAFVEILLIIINLYVFFESNHWINLVMAFVFMLCGVLLFLIGIKLVHLRKSIIFHVENYDDIQERIKRLTGPFSLN